MKQNFTEYWNFEKVPKTHAKVRTFAGIYFNANNKMASAKCFASSGGIGGKICLSKLHMQQNVRVAS